MTEIEKVKKRRDERAVEKAQHEEKLLLMTDRARAEADDFEEKGDKFHFEQSKVRSIIRLREGRMKPIDFLITYLDGSDEFDVELDEPYMVFKIHMDEAVKVGGGEDQTEDEVREEGAMEHTMIMEGTPTEV